MRLWNTGRAGIHAVFAAIMGLAFLTACEEAWGVTAARQPYRRVDATTKQEVTHDANAIWLENEHLKLAIMTDGALAGQVLSLVYKPTMQELANPLTLQGYCWERFNGLPAMKTVEAKGEIVSQAESLAEASVSWLQTGELGEKKVVIKHTKRYILKKGTTCLFVQWRQENAGDQELMYSARIKHLGGQTATVLSGPSKLILPQGPAVFDDFVKPATNWTARLSGTHNSEAVPMVANITDYRKILQQFTWRKEVRYTLETVLHRLTLKPGEADDVPYVLMVTANLANVGYVAPELAAAVEPAIDLKAGQAVALQVHIAAAADLGEKRLEGQIVTAAGEPVAAVPNQQVKLHAGKISTLAYNFTPPKEGVYFLNLTVFDRQQPLQLGAEVNSQKTFITLPMVAGPPPAVVVQNWQQGAATWTRRSSRDVKPWRTLINSSELRAGQVLVPERVFPEDKMGFDRATQPATVRLAGGEYECLQFVVETPEPVDPMSVQVETSPLRNERGGALEQAQVREQIYLTTDTPSAYMDFPVGQWPDPLFETDWPTRIPNAPITQANVAVIKGCRKRVYWMTIQARRDAEPGTYKGEVSISLAGRAAGAFPIEVHVRGFALPRQPFLRCSTAMVGWKGLKTNLTIMGLPPEEVLRLDKGNQRTPSAIDAYRRLVLEYGWTPTMSFGSVREWERFKDVGRGPTVYPAAKTKANEEWLERHGLLRHAFTYAPFDEHPDGRVPEVAEWARKWKAESKIPILDCYYGTNVRPLFGLVDIWLGQDPRQEWAKERKKAGDQFFSCNSTLIWHVEYVPVQGRAQFWNDFAIGVDGRYVYSTCRWTEDVYKKNWTSGNYMGSAVYPGPYGVTTSIRMETLRDGVEDYDYLAILRRTVSEQAEKAAADVVAQARQIIDDPNIVQKLQTTDQLHQMREVVAGLIEKLAGKQ